VLGERAGRSFDAAVAFARSWQPDLIIHDPMSLEGLLAARVIGVPAALALWGPTGTHEPDHVRIVPDDISGSFRRYGLGEFTPDLIEHVIDPCPAALRPPTTADRLPVRYVPYNLAGSAPDWVWEEPSRPRVCVSWSTALSIMSGPDSYALPEIIRGVAALDVEVVVTATRQDVVKLGSVEPSIRVLEHCPLRLLLPTCDAVVHHGGAGTTLTAVSAGVPQVVLTYASEQARNGERVVNAGIGRHLPGHLVDVEQISAAVADVVSDSSYGRSADVVRDEMRRRPTPVELVATLEKLIRG
jgi:UDP:flavonoid glycosyltransferase YjiC (YdhE family)